ncbi:hypothetical protein QR680_002628 [Steinernema hermaphroditum]|uniref:t-SNARE coiled-coil homology domain-containing protein n=1 Tax=Steinernema hermaphroditum TaxID=289476 RepID=A0AA39H3E6_9BILA|nr:hypothetical protein QR680_002628 [Steinernema hermaphroditum]
MCLGTNLRHALYCVHVCRFSQFVDVSTSFADVILLADMSTFRGNGFGGNEHHGFMEEQNNQMADQLSSKVSALKRITIAIGDDVREQNRLLNEMESDFDSSKSLLGSTMRKLTSVYRAGGKSLMLYVILFCFFVFFVTYYLARH